MTLLMLGDPSNLLGSPNNLRLIARRTEPMLIACCQGRFYGLFSNGYPTLRMSGMRCAEFLDGSPDPNRAFTKDAVGPTLSSEQI